MKGKFHFRVESDNLLFEFDIKRNITILQGYSASGKTTLLEILLQYLRNGESSGYSVETDANYYVFMQEPTLGTWHDELEKLHDTIIFVEENNQFVMSRDFAGYVGRSGNYFVIVNRPSIGCLSYSTKEIYTLQSKPSSENDTKQIYHFEPVYPKEKLVCTDTGNIDDMFELVITEDTNAGFRFFKNWLTTESTEVIAAGGNSKIITELKNSENSYILCIADGAAYGAYIKEIYEYAETATENVVIFVPESFEYLLLKSGVITFDDSEKVMDSTYDFVDCSLYVSWERFFTAIAIEHSDRTNKYRKNTKKSFYCNNEDTQKKIQKILPMDLQKFASKNEDVEESLNSMNLFG